MATPICKILSSLAKHGVTLDFMFPWPCSLVLLVTLLNQYQLEYVCVRAVSRLLTQSVTAILGLLSCCLICADSCACLALMRRQLSRVIPTAVMLQLLYGHVGYAVFFVDSIASGFAAVLQDRRRS
jgi:hypothetical protein